MLNLIDLCAGTGAFSHVFEKNDKFKCVFANDLIDSSKSIYDANHTIELTKKDIHDVTVTDIPVHNILCAGFPCQPFSLAGKKEGFDDPRSNVFWKIIEIIKHHKPSIIILENVKNLVSHDNNNTFKVITQKLERENYHLKYKVLDTAKITGIPQHRERIYIFGFLNKHLYDKFDLDFPIVEKKNIANYLELEIPDKYYYTDKLKVYDTVKSDVTKHISENVLYQYRRYYVRENKSNECPTLTSNMGTGGNNLPLLKDDKGIRKLTPRETFNLQGFPSTYVLPNISDTKLYSLAGNAVSYPVIELICNKLISIL